MGNVSASLRAATRSCTRRRITRQSTPARETRMRIVKPCRPSAVTDGRGEVRKNAGRSGQLTPAQVVGAEGVPLRAIARQQSQQRPHGLRPGHLFHPTPSDRGGLSPEDEVPERGRMRLSLLVVPAGSVRPGPERGPHVRAQHDQQSRARFSFRPTPAEVSLRESPEYVTGTERCLSLSPTDTRGRPRDRRLAA